MAWQDQVAKNMGYIPKKRGNKFHAVKSRIPGGIKLYDSGAERDRAQELKLLERAKAIRNLDEQPIIQMTKYHTYRPDFAYQRKGEVAWVFEDVKGAKTERFVINCRLWKERGPGILRTIERKGKIQPFKITDVINPDITDESMYQQRNK